MQWEHIILCLLFCSVYAYPVPEGKSGPSVVEGLQRQVELLGAVRSGTFCVDCDTFQSILQSSMNCEWFNFISLIRFQDKQQF